MKNLVVAACVALVVAVAGGEAKAGHHHRSSCGYGGGYYPTSGFSVSVGYGSFPRYAGGGIYSGYAPSRPVWHNTTHYDYHPPEVYRHRNHYHVAPGHYDLHRTGHWHY